MSEPLCKCGHPRRVHCGASGRNPCTGEVRQIIKRGFIDQRPGDVMLDETQAANLVEEFEVRAKKNPSCERLLRHLLKRGYRIITCRCQLYHTIEIGQVLIHKPGDKNATLIKP